MTNSLLIPEMQIPKDQFFEDQYNRRIVHTNEAPPIFNVTRNLSRQESKDLKYTKEIIRLDPNEVNLMQTRTVDIDHSNVSQILQFLDKEGVLWWLVQKSK